MAEVASIPREGVVWGARGTLVRRFGCIHLLWGVRAASAVAAVRPSLAWPMESDVTSTPSN